VEMWQWMRVDETRDEGQCWGAGVGVQCAQVAVARGTVTVTGTAVTAGQ
jgi:hypothetical protein